MARTRLATLALLSFFESAGAQQASPDLVLLNGKIFTSNSSRPYVEALAIRGERIVAVGTTNQISSLAGNQTKRLDLTGHLVIPGINDAHYHLSLSPAIGQIALRSRDPGWEEVTRAVAEAVAAIPKGAWIHMSVGPKVVDDPRATRFTLDGMAPDHPLRLSTAHMAIVNSRALAALGIGEGESDPLGGHYERSDHDALLTGRMFGYANVRSVVALAEMVNDDSALPQIRRFLNEAVRLGITSVQNMSAPVVPARSISLLKKASTPIRWRLVRMPITDRNGRRIHEYQGLPRNQAPNITVSGTKWLLDGSPIERTAAMRKPYDDAATSGEMYFPQKEMEAMLRESLESEDQLIVHVIGDRTAETFLNAMERTGGRKVWSSRRVRIEHGTGLTPDLLVRTQDMGAIVVRNPAFLSLRELFVSRYGAERTDRMSPFKSLLEAGIPLAIGSDGPVNPYLNIMLASTDPMRRTDALTREQAVTAYTLTSAYAEFTEKDKGSIEPGKLADIAVLSQDIFQVPFKDLANTESILTFVGGRIVFDAKVIPVR